MKTEARYEQIIKASKLLIAVVFLALFVMMYKWVLLFGVNYPQQGNVVLAILMGVAFIPSLIIFLSIRPTSRFHVWKSKRNIDRWTYLVLLILFVWHLGAGLAINDREVQTVFLYAPAGVIATTAAISLIALIMYGAKEIKKGQL